MRLFKLFKAEGPDPEPNKAIFSQPAGTAGLIVTDELDKASEACKTAVGRIAKECRAKNQKFRYDPFSWRRRY
jgi:hypothetical protein